MIKFHIIYTLDNDVFVEGKEFESFSDAEKWLEEIGSTYWEIGMLDEDFKKLSWKSS